MHTWATRQKGRGKTIGFVPTMGALHTGHLELVRRAREENQLVICSIFVNPIQFNKAEDLENYPRTLDSDLRQLGSAGCDAVFSPDTEEMYPEKETRVYDFGHMDKVMEGKYREGHFNGVAIVVDKLLRVTVPDRAYFGEKDFQQLQIIRELVRQEGHPVEITGCPTVREPGGLALSSRNIRLSLAQRREAQKIYEALKMAKGLYPETPVDEIMTRVASFINASPELQVEYFEIVRADDLLPAGTEDKDKEVVGCIAVYAGDIRLIDNMRLNS